MSAALESALERAIAEVPECVAAACVDMRASTALGEHASDGVERAVLELAASTAADVLGCDVGALERALGVAPAGGGPARLDEATVLGRDHLHVLLRSRRHEDVALVFLCRPTAAAGLVAITARLALSLVDAAL